MISKTHASGQKPRCGPGSSTAINFRLLPFRLKFIGSSNRVSSTIKFFDSMQKYKNNILTCLPNN